MNITTPHNENPRTKKTVELIFRVPAQKIFFKKGREGRGGVV